jgi:hypothetical protein
MQLKAGKAELTAEALGTVDGCVLIKGRRRNGLSGRMVGLTHAPQILAIPCICHRHMLQATQGVNGVVGAERMDGPTHGPQILNARARTHTHIASRLRLDAGVAVPSTAPSTGTTPMQR